MNHTVKNYEEGELTEEGFSGEIRNKKSRWVLDRPADSFGSGRYGPVDVCDRRK